MIWFETRTPPPPPATKTPRIAAKVAELVQRKMTCWEMARVFLENRDAHGIHDMGVEIQALDRAIAELRAIA